MVSHLPLFILFVAREEESALAPLLAYLRLIPHVETAVRSRLPGDVSDVEIVVTTRTDLVRRILRP
jgi:hypothetical protein